ncbi:MAG: hypothetical protein OYL92_17065 [Acidobacteriota bacterium]|nr:hypothetical protein [Acidobacteriota bacterium]MDE3266678.1 hypothetical protein [Acidobacteriota bacterium]
MEQYQAYKPPPERAIRRARSALFDLIDESTGEEVYAFHMLALERQELEEEGMKYVEEADEMIREIDEAWHARAAELASGPRVGGDPEDRSF